MFYSSVTGVSCKGAKRVAGRLVNMATLYSPEAPRLVQAPAHMSAAVRSAAAVRNVAAWLDTRDHWMMLRLNHWRPPHWMRLWMIAATRGGDGWLWYAMGLTVALFGGTDRI